MKYILFAVILLSLNGCAILVGGIVGAAVTPFIQPQVERVLGVIGADFVDPDGVEAVRAYDAKKAGSTK